MTNKRQRELARAKYERQLARRQERAVRDKTLRIGALIAIVVLTISGFAWAQRPHTTAQTNPTPTSSATRPNVVNKCTDGGAIRADNIKFGSVPTSAKAGSAIDFRTNCGSIKVALNPKAPRTTAVMSFLAGKKYFDQTECHRLTTVGFFVLQCGDPTATGTGGPGFKFKDENLPKGPSSANVYKAGTVAMANSGPDTNGSQFFIVYKDSPLPPSYSVWGQVVAGLPIVKTISEAGVVGGSADGKPAQRVVIKQAVVTS